MGDIEANMMAALVLMVLAIGMRGERNL